VIFPLINTRCYFASRSSFSSLLL